MPKYFCDYCDTYLTHDSPSVRKTHCAGRKHRENVKFYYEKWFEQNIHKGPPIPPPSSFTPDFPPPPLLHGLPTGPPPPMLQGLPTGPPPPLQMLRGLPTGPPPPMLQGLPTGPPPPIQANLLLPPPTTCFGTGNSFIQ